jgi:hypothetical protein
MTCARSVTGAVVRFPPSLKPDASGVIRPPSSRALGGIAAAISPEELLRFASSLVRSARRSRDRPKWAAVNRQRQELARICVDRIVAENLFPEAFLDRAIGEMRWGRRWGETGLTAAGPNSAAAPTF